MENKINNPKGLHQKYFIQKIVDIKAFIERQWLSVKNFVGTPFEDLLYDKPQRLVKEHVEENSEYFLLRLDLNGTDLTHVKASRIAAHSYADAIENHLPEVAKDIREKYPLI